MAYSNNMTDLINKIEIKLGTRPLNLPPELRKAVWADKVITPMSIVTWSRYFPNKVIYHVDGTHPKKNGWYLLDEDMFDGVKILGVQNIDWGTFNGSSYGGSYGYYDTYSLGVGVDDMFNIVGGANIGSLFANGIYPTFEYPNRFRLESSFGRPTSGISTFNLYVLVQHSSNLLTISPTQMDTFEDLAISDVASFLYNELKYFDGIETVFANVNIRLDDLQEKANKRDEVMSFIKENYVSAANQNQPMLLCI